MKRLSLSVALVLGATFGFSSTARAHGESIRGSGGGTVNTIGAQIGKGVVLGARYDVRLFDRISHTELLQYRANSEDVHSHREEHGWFAGVGYVITENFDVNVQLPVRMYRNFKDNGDEYVQAGCEIVPGSGQTAGGDRGSCISTTKTSAGLGDVQMLGRYRFFNRREQHLAALFGMSLPTGRVRNRVDKINPETGRREFLGAHNQPGNAAVGFQLGASYTGRLGAGFSLSADLLALINTEGLGYRQGHAGQANLALSWSGPRVPLTPVLELNGSLMQQDMEDGEIKRNSGGGLLYLSPGLILKLGKRHQLFGSLSYPIVQALGGIQNRELLRVSAGYAVVLGGRDKTEKESHDHHHHGGAGHRP